MGKPKARSTLYRLIEAGQLGRRALLAPLTARGLEPGDDALLFLFGKRPLADAEIAAALELTPAALRDRVARLSRLGLVHRPTADEDAPPTLLLTRDGRQLRKALTDSWMTLERALAGSLKRRERKTLRRTLGRFVERLRG